MSHIHLRATVVLLLLTFQQASAQWNLSGNSNASNSTSKLGTTNAIDLRLFTNNLERMRILSANGRVGIGTTTPGASLDVRSTSNLLVRFNGGSQMYMGLYENGTQRGYLGSFAGNAPDVDFGTNTANTTGRLHLTTKAIPRLSIDSAGNIGIGTTKPRNTLDIVDSTSFLYVLRATSSFSGPQYRTAVYAHSINADGYGYGVQAYGGFIGLMGVGRGGSYTGMTRGIYGYVHGNPGKGDRVAVDGRAEGGANAYGVFGYAGAASTFNAAGYFNGSLWAVGSLYNISDRKFKQNIQPVANGLEQVLKLKPSTYTFKTSEYKSMRLPEGKQLGLIADELKQVFPELVSTAVHPAEYDQKDRTKVITPKITYEGVNYQGLVPVLIASIQELKQENDKQQRQIEDLKTLVNKLANGQMPITFSTAAYLEQSTPNPASGTTRIGYQIPETITSARLTLTNTKGQVVKTFTLSKRVAGQLNVNTSLLAAGTYNYTLYVDGRPVDTKRLLVVK